MEPIHKIFQTLLQLKIVSDILSPLVIAFYNELYLGTKYRVY